MARELFSMHAVVSKKEVFSSARVRFMILNEMRQVSKWMRRDLEGTTENWRRKPDFENVIRYRGGDPVLRVGLIGSGIAKDHWERVNFGTQHLYLDFHAEYQPMTSVPNGYPFPKNQPRTTLAPYKWHNPKSRKRIHARNWIGTPDNLGWIEIIYYPQLQEAVDFAIERGLQPK